MRREKKVFVEITTPTHALYGIILHDQVTVETDNENDHLILLYL